MAQLVVIAHIQPEGPLTQPEGGVQSGGLAVTLAISHNQTDYFLTFLVLRM